MHRDRFLDSKEKIYADIQREVDWVNEGNSAGNFLCALGLLCYTEFFGGVDRGIFNAGESKANFNHFIKQMGQHYTSFLLDHDVYNIFRCGLAHEYYVKHDFTIAIFTKPGRNDVGIDYLYTEKKYVFRVEPYFRDFKRAVENLEKTKFP